MKKLLIILMIISGLALAGCENLMTSNGNTKVWQEFTGSAGVGFWAYGYDPDDPEALLVFVKTSSVSRVEYWEGREKARSAEWLDCTGDAITYRAPDGETFTQTYSITDNGLSIDESYGIISYDITGEIFWRHEGPSWWSWEFSDPPPSLSGSSSDLTGGSGIGFWGAGSDPENPEHVWVFINTSSVSRVEYWINQELYNWGHWIDAVGNTIIYRRHDYINPATQTYHIENNRLQIGKGSSAIAWGTFRRFERPEWWIPEQH
jgi:hypothetical protein